MAGRPTWILDELAHAGRENVDPQHVARYDAKMDADAAAELRSLRDFGLADGVTIVDLGTGTGQFALAAAAAADRVVAVDVSPVMLDRLDAKLAARDVGNVERVRAGFLTYEHQGAPADLVYTRFALHHLPDFWKSLALKRMAAMLRPGGLLRLSDVVYDFAPEEAETVLENWISSLAGTDVEQGWTREELEEHIRDEHSTFTWLLEPMIRRAGFAIEAREISDDRMLARYVCVKQG
ncbi:MAG: class I SAM-dependent methyltransferase [Solirubrobacterales bacterium]